MAPNPVLGTIGITALYGNNQSLSEDFEEGANAPGWYLPVNWSDDDKDGWSNNGTPPNAMYTPDKDDPYIAGGDRDLFKFGISLGIPQPPAQGQLVGKLKLTYDTAKIKVYRTNTKGAVDNPNQSSLIASETVFTNIELGENPHFYAEGIAGSTAFKDAFIKVEVTLVPDDVQMERQSDKVEVTVFEATQVGFFEGPQQADNQARFSHAAIKGSSDVNGIRSWDTPDANCVGFHNCMELQATIKPGVPTSGFNPYQGMVNLSDPVAAFQVTWSMHREKFVAVWDKVGESAWSPLFASQHQKWTPDDSVATGNADLDLTIENNHIYFIDVSGQYGKTRPPDYVQMYANFRN